MCCNPNLSHSSVSRPEYNVCLKERGKYLLNYYLQTAQYTGSFQYVVIEVKVLSNERLRIPCEFEFSEHKLVMIV